MIKPLIPFVLVCLFLGALPAHSQKVITSQSGQKIIINPDGTWSEYKETNSTSIDSIPTPSGEVKPEVSGEMKIEAQLAFDNNEQDDYQLIRADIMKKYDELKQEQFKNKNNIKVVKNEIKKAKKEERDDLALKRLEERKLQYYLSEYDLEREMDDLKPFKISVDRIDKQGFNSKLYQTLKVNYTAFAGDDFAIAQDEPKSENSDSFESQDGERDDDDNDKNDGSDKANYTTTPIENPLTEAEIREKEIKRELTYYTFDIDDNDVLRNPPEVECKVKLKGIDKRTRKERTELESGHLFGYTHPNIKSYFKEKDYLTCNAKLSKVGGLYYLSFEVRIASIKANKSYGSLDKGSGIRIKLINGETVNLYNISAATGFIEPLTGVTVYQTNYPMEKSEFKKLSKTELDKIGVIWSTGYEEYEIYEVDFLINQAECLKNS